MTLLLTYPNRWEKRKAKKLWRCPLLKGTSTQAGTLGTWLTSSRWHPKIHVTWPAPWAQRWLTFPKILSPSLTPLINPSDHGARGVWRDLLWLPFSEAYHLCCQLKAASRGCVVGLAPSHYLLLWYQTPASLLQQPKLFGSRAGTNLNPWKDKARRE